MDPSTDDPSSKSQARRESELIDSGHDAELPHADRNSLARIRPEKVQEIKRRLIQRLAQRMQNSQNFS